eukprot:1868583-Prymnesium_polylepis.1
MSRTDCSRQGAEAIAESEQRPGVGRDSQCFAPKDPCWVPFSKVRCVPSLRGVTQAVSHHVSRYAYTYTYGTYAFELYGDADRSACHGCPR